MGQVGFDPSEKLKVEWKDVDSNAPKLGVASKSEIRAIRELSDTEFREYERAASKLGQYMIDQELFVMVQSNYGDFQSVLQQTLGEYIQKPSYLPPMETLIFRVDRSLLNFLLALRIFLDHSRFNLNKRYGGHSERVREFEKACTNEYEHFFSYRFIYKLRNYAQHCGMPVGEMELASTLEDPATGRVTRSLAVYFDRDGLLSEYDSWGKLKQEIQTLPAKFEINSHVAQAMECIKRINLNLIKNDLREIVESAQIVQNLAAPLKHESGRPCILFLAKDLISGSESMKVSIRWIPLHVLDFIPGTIQ